MAIKVLLVEDDESKAEQIEAVLLEEGFCRREDVRIEDSQMGAKAALRETQFDLLLLDISIPREHRGIAEAHGGIALLHEIEHRAIYTKPTHIIGITAHSSLLQAAGADFLAFAWPVLFYDRGSDAWRSTLRQRLSRMQTSAESRMQFGVHLAIVTALFDTELDAVKQIGWSWQPSRVDGDHTTYFDATFGAPGAQKRALAAAAARMGLAEAAVIASKVIQTFRPRYLAMSGVMGGVSGRVALGDIVVAEPCWDYGSGKWVSGEGGDVFEPSPYQMTLSPFLRECFRQIAKDEDFLRSIHSDFRGSKPPRPPTLHLGPVGTGASVVANERLVQRIIAQNRKLLGIEMEAYGVLAGATECAAPRPEAFVVKGVSDFADAHKSDDYQNYCAWVSAMTVRHLAETYLYR